jgi:thymidylate synthase
VNRGNQPILHVTGRTLPEAWQKAMLALFEQGCNVPTSFDRAGDPQSKDATVTVVVEDPFAEPRLHKRAIPAGLEELEIYRLEVVAGVHDHWVDRFGQQWNYTYHERLRAYDSGDGDKLDQIGTMIDLIADSPEPFRRRYQVITWIPAVDPFLLDPPCLQRLHFRLLPGQEPGSLVLNMNADWRSRDGYKAWFMNAYAFTDLQRVIARELSRRMKTEVRVGRYCDKSDSLHIYGKDFEGAGGFRGFLEQLRSRSLADLTWATGFAEPIFKEARHKLAAQLEAERRGLGKGTLPPGLDVMTFPHPGEWDE